MAEGTLAVVCGRAIVLKTDRRHDNDVRRIALLLLSLSLLSHAQTALESLI